MTDAYAASGVDTPAADRAVAALVGVLRTIDTGKPSRSVPLPGHYAAVLEVAPNLGIAVGTDGVGSKLIVAEQTGRLRHGRDRLRGDERQRRRLRRRRADRAARLPRRRAGRPRGDARDRPTGSSAGAELAGVEIPGGEVAVLPELIRGHPSPNGFDLTAACFGTVALDAIVTGADCAPGDALIGLPVIGPALERLLARAPRAARACRSTTARSLGGATLADALLEPTVIYVRAALELLRSGLPVHGLAHITGGGLLNLLRLNDAVGFDVADPLPVPPIFGLVQERGGVADAEMWEVFNMGCGFCVVVPEAAADDAATLLAGAPRRHAPDRHGHRPPPGGSPARPRRPSARDL